MKAKIDFHVHPFFERYGLDDVLKAMRHNGIGGLGLPQLDKDIYPYVVQEAKKYDAIRDDKGVKFADGKIIFNAKEYNTQEGFQLLTIGESVESPEKPPFYEAKEILDKGLEKGSLVILDHPFADNWETKTAGHISGEKAAEVEDICKEYSGQIGVEYNGYCNNMVRELIKWGFNTGPLYWLLQKNLGLPESKIEYSDVNKKTLELSERLENEGYNVPVVADTDLHARRKHALNKMGTACFTTNIYGDYPSEALAGIKENIFSGNYKNNYDTVSSVHIGRHYAPHAVLQNFFLKPRG